jgi:hypothetical protein
MTEVREVKSCVWRKSRMWSGSTYADKVAELQGESTGKTLRGKHKGQNSSCGQCNP